VKSGNAQQRGTRAVGIIAEIYLKRTRAASCGAPRKTSRGETSRQAKKLHKRAL